MVIPPDKNEAPMSSVEDFQSATHSIMELIGPDHGNPSVFLGSFCGTCLIGNNTLKAKFCNSLSAVSDDLLYHSTNCPYQHSPQIIPNFRKTTTEAISQQSVHVIFQKWECGWED
ncbi:uncharacterized protein PGTG_17474 [Puccinia graminis f. sp. tritici CRL 75-36-700-3]|uniref:Uncharacterized protein n=1 Tax=Puccinia graminis f. sp. tritici (strain CRL 75-36-700-3 / race SCCL) TaxID=418459 RepID=E3L5B2_PUCGT|nr:uncharacterized protein PGTG_17474 [Puccinia graminis f. sp. tritici CRL 75-36-700-3]EFP91737.1 hypothetical protein PGTG_17474 [Puccinia graminis f. sp. tritici CRL 75-36-700-3]